ncbi:PRTRC system protein A [Cupriavidus sp. D39]|uniref:PRTRC system protein A n=1 Tax=Cupriavidus sp. D39 TaxID=2997877 RepID=UPI003B640DF2
MQQSFPTVMMPRFGSLQAMQADGERLVVASNGLFLEILRPWLNLVRRVGQFDVATAIPYGMVKERTELICGKVPPALIGEFAALARQTMPNEAGAWITWRRDTGTFRLVPVKVLEHSAGHLRYERPELVAGESLVMDCHSHGAAEAFFSHTDNTDDRHDVKFAFVLGNCASRHPSMKVRLCAKGVLEPAADVPAAWRHAVSQVEVAL